MTDVVFLLHLEHRNMLQLLEILERQVLALAVDGTGDIGMMRSIVDYYMTYPEYCHHPIEDAIFARLRQRDAAAAQPLGSLREDHMQLPDRIRALADHLADAADPSSPASLHVVKAAREFVSFYRHHIEREEVAFLPAALRVLSEDDWREIDFGVFDSVDPLFHETDERRFDALRRQILDGATAL